MVGQRLPFMTIIVLFWIMAIMDGWRGIKKPGLRWWLRAGRLPSLSTLALTSLGGAAGHISSLVSLLCLTLFLKRWQPVRVFRLVIWERQG
ncbi:L-lactate permease [Shigella flexneri]